MPSSACKDVVVLKEERLLHVSTVQIKAGQKDVKISVPHSSWREIPIHSSLFMDCELLNFSLQKRKTVIDLKFFLLDQ